MEPFYHPILFFSLFFFSANLCSDSGSVKVFLSDVKQKKKWRRNVALNLERTATRGHPLVQFTFYVNHYVYIYITQSWSCTQSLVEKKKKRKNYSLSSIDQIDDWPTQTQGH
jgi:hypothetical protein